MNSKWSTLLITFFQNSFIQLMEIGDNGDSGVHAQVMEAHMKELNENFPNLTSAYAMPQEQREAVAKRDKIRRQRIKEEKAFRQEEKDEQERAAHEVWCAWYKLAKKNKI